MGNRRMGRQRLFSLEKKGKESTNRPGAGIADAVVYSKVSRDGAEITTEIVVDLGTSAAAIKSKDTNGDVIGVDGGGAAYLTRLTDAVNGIITDAEIICTETPTTGEPDLNLAYASSATLAFDGAGGSDLLVDTAADLVIGLNKVGAGINDNSASGDYVYLAVGTGSGPAAGTYAAGKLIIRIYGYAVEADI
jgi:hypothetical protein